MPDRTRRGDVGRVLTAVAVAAAVTVCVVLVAVAIGEAHNTMAVKLVQWALEAAVVAAALAVLGAITWGDG